MPKPTGANLKNLRFHKEGERHNKISRFVCQENSILEKLEWRRRALSHLKSSLPNLDPSAKVFALAILQKNGVKLNKHSYERLVQGLSYWGSYGLDAEDAKLSVVARDESFDA